MSDRRYSFASGAEPLSRAVGLISAGCYTTVPSRSSSSAPLLTDLAGLGE